MWPFSRKRKLSPEKFGELLGEILRKTVAEISDNRNRVKMQFEERNWKFNFSQYHDVVLKMFVNITQQKIVRDFQDCSNPSNLINSFIDTLPKEYTKQSKMKFFESSLELTKSDSPLLTASRIAAQNYFNKKLDNLGLEKIMYFGSSAKAFNEVLESAIKNIRVK